MITSFILDIVLMAIETRFPRGNCFDRRSSPTTQPDARGPRESSVRKRIESSIDQVIHRLRPVRFVSKASDAISACNEDNSSLEEKFVTDIIRWKPGKKPPEGTAVDEYDDLVLHILDSEPIPPRMKAQRPPKDYQGVSMENPMDSSSDDEPL